MNSAKKEGKEIKGTVLRHLIIRNLTSEPRRKGREEKFTTRKKIRVDGGNAGSYAEKKHKKPNNLYIIIHRPRSRGIDARGERRQIKEREGKLKETVEVV